MVDRGLAYTCSQQEPLEIVGQKARGIESPSPELDVEAISK